MRGGFLLGSVVLIATWVLVQDGVSGRVSDASNIFVGLLRRVMSPEAAGVADHTRPGSKATLNDPTTRPGAGGGGRPPSYT